MIKRFQAWCIFGRIMLAFGVIAEIAGLYFVHLEMPLVWLFLLFVGLICTIISFEGIRGMVNALSDKIKAIEILTPDEQGLLIRLHTSSPEIVKELIHNNKPLINGLVSKGFVNVVIDENGTHYHPNEKWREEDI